MEFINHKRNSPCWCLPSPVRYYISMFFRDPLKHLTQPLAQVPLGSQILPGWVACALSVASPSLTSTSIRSTWPPASGVTLLFAPSSLSRRAGVPAGAQLAPAWMPLRLVATPSFSYQRCPFSTCCLNSVHSKKGPVSLRTSLKSHYSLNKRPIKY